MSKPTPDLRTALAALLPILPMPGEEMVARYERAVNAFHRETGNPLPSRDDPNDVKAAHTVAWQAWADGKVNDAVAALAAPVEVTPVGRVLAPLMPNEAMWGGLARDIVMWTRMGARQTGTVLYEHLRRSGRTVPDWLLSEIPDIDVVPPKGTVAVVIYRAMLDALPDKPPSLQEVYAKIESDSLDAIMEVIGSPAVYNNGKNVMRGWFLRRLRSDWNLPEPTPDAGV